MWLLCWVCTSSCVIAPVLTEGTPKLWVPGIHLHLGLPFMSNVLLDREQTSRALCFITCKTSHFHSWEHLWLKDLGLRLCFAFLEPARLDLTKLKWTGPDVVHLTVRYPIQMVCSDKSSRFLFFTSVMFYKVTINSPEFWTITAGENTGFGSCQRLGTHFHPMINM